MRKSLLIFASVMTIGLPGCTTLSPVDIQGKNRQAFLDVLANTPAGCVAYREAYVNGFKNHVQALAINSPEVLKQTRRHLSDNHDNLVNQGLSEADCTRPYCIIEPLQNGRLDSWCGYRIKADEGTDLYQWIEWGAVQTALQRL